MLRFQHVTRYTYNIIIYNTFGARASSVHNFYQVNWIILFISVCYYYGPVPTALCRSANKKKTSTQKNRTKLLPRWMPEFIITRAIKKCFKFLIFRCHVESYCSFQFFSRSTIYIMDEKLWTKLYGKQTSQRVKTLMLEGEKKKFSRCVFFLSSSSLHLSLLVRLVGNRGQSGWRRVGNVQKGLRTIKIM